MSMNAYTLQRLQECYANDPMEALRFAARLKFQTLGTYRDAIQRGYSAMQHPETYLAMGVDPESAKQAALQALVKLVAPNC